LLGDSILDNKKYVNKDESVYDVLIKNTSYDIINLAVNESTISNVYSQLNKISSIYNNGATYIVLAVGGNNIMNDKNVNLDLLFEKYTLLIESIFAKLPDINLILLNLYYPLINEYNDYIYRWNKMLTSYINRNKIYKIYFIPLDIIINKNDIVFNVEPSKTASEKISFSILSIIK